MSAYFWECHNNSYREQEFSKKIFLVHPSGQTTACEGILCSPQGSHAYIDSTYFESLEILCHTFHSKPHFYSTGNDYCVVYAALYNNA